MLKSQFKSLFFVTFLLFSISLGVAAMASGSVPVEQLKEAIVKIRMSEPSTAVRTAAAEHLAELARETNPQEVDDRTVADMISLMDTSDDSVRYWVARSLGNLGVRAKVAVPKLQEKLIEVDCIQGSLTSASGIRFALAQMGAPSTPAACFGTFDSRSK